MKRLNVILKSKKSTIVEEVRELTKEANKIFNRLSEDNPANKLIKKLIKSTGVSGGSKGNKIGIGYGKNKEKFAKQLQQLQRFVEKATEYEENIQQTKQEAYESGEYFSDEKHRKAYETFRDRYGDDITVDEWENFVSELNKHKSELAQYGYEDRSEGINIGSSLSAVFGDMKDRYTISDILKVATSKKITDKITGTLTGKDFINFINEIISSNGDVDRAIENVNRRKTENV